MNITLSTIVKLSMLGLVFSLASCTTLYNTNHGIPGLDRILNYFSKAEVGPVKKANGDIIAGTENTLQSSENLYTADSRGHTDAGKTAHLATSSSLPTSTPPPSNEFVNPVLAAPSSKASAGLTNTPAKSNAPPKPRVKNTNNVISGTVTLLGKDGVISSEGLIVRLKRVDGIALQNSVKEASYEVDMVNKAYTPGNIVIHKGDKLNFVNKDKIQHNVFSSTGENAFDLGTFGVGLQREVKLNEDGVVKVYCNIHPGMAAFVAVDDTGVSQVIQSDDGFFEFLNLPAGEYQLVLWSVRGEQTQKVTLTAEQKLHLDLTFDTSNYESPAPLNKYGEIYKKKNIRREFY